MSKYIIEIAKEYEEYFKGILICGIADGKFAVDVIAREDLEELNSDYINEHFSDLQDDAYDKGYAQCQDDYGDALKHAKDTAYQKGINDGSLDVKQRVEGAYQKGFEKGKDVRIKGCEGCMYQDTTIEHNPCNLCCNAFLNRWTAKPQKDDDIKVGDEVTDKDGDKTIVTNIHGDLFDGLCSDGSTMTDLFLDDNHKTGRHFDIQSILEDMRHD